MSEQGGQRYSEAQLADVKARADLAGIIGQRVALKRNGPEFVGLCPFHQESSPSFTVVPAKRMFHCFGCRKSGDVFVWLQEQEKLSFKEAVARLTGGAPLPVPNASSRMVTAQAAQRGIERDAEAVREKIARARKIWGEAFPAQNTLAERYLANRGLRGIVVPMTLRYHPRLWCQEAGDRLPALVGAIMDARQQIIGVHRTYLNVDTAQKAKLASPKKMLGLTRGGHVWLGLPMAGRLAVAEGIETALSVMQAQPGLGVFAALSLGNMDAPVPREVRELILCADGDNKDQKSADGLLQAAARKHAAPGRVVRIARPKPGMDFNDMVRGGCFDQ